MSVQIDSFLRSIQQRILKLHPHSHGLRIKMEQVSKSNLNEKYCLIES